MKRLGISIILVVLLVFSAIGCGGEKLAVNDETKAGLVDLLLVAALGGRGEYQLDVEAEEGAGFLKTVSGSVETGAAGMEVASVSLQDGILTEVGRVSVSASGDWGPLTTVSGAKALLLLEGKALKGYYVYQPRFAAVLTGGSRYEDYVVDASDTGLVALALTYSGELQAAANLLAASQNIHPGFGGLPFEPDICGFAAGEEVDYTATAWAGYSAAVLASFASDNPRLWQEAKAYATYLEGATPENTETCLAGWLLFTKLDEKYGGYAESAEKWRPVPGDEYDPFVALYLLQSKGKAKNYVDFNYEPASSVDQWVHYNVLLALNKLPAGLEPAVEAVPGGMAVLTDAKVSLQATSWLLLALQGGLGQ